MKKALRIIGAVVVALFVGYTFYFLWKQSQPQPVVFDLVTPEQRTVQKKTIATGTVEARQQVDLKPQVTGIISELRVKAGDRVNTGDVIAVLRVIPDMSQLNDAQSKVESARISLEETEREAQRSQALFDKGVVSREENEQKQSELAKAKETLTAAKYAVDVITKGSSKRSATVNTTEVRSTMNGIVLSVPVKVGTSVSGSSQFSEGTTIAKVGDMRDVIFRGNIDETSVDQLQTGMMASITIGAKPDDRLTANLEYISPEGVLQNGAKVFEIKAGVAIPEGVKIRSGYSANAEIILAEAKDALTVDESAIVFEEDKPYVYRLTSKESDEENQKFERIPVELGISDGLCVVVKSGVDKSMKLRGRKK